MTSERTLCSSCNERKLTYNCKGCKREFCLLHLQQHRKELDEQLDEIIDNHDRFERKVFESKRFLTTLRQHKTVVDGIETKLARLSTQIKEVRGENDFNEIDLQRWTDDLNAMTKESGRSMEISLRATCQALTSHGRLPHSVVKPKEESVGHKWKQQATVITGGNEFGPTLIQSSYPETVFIARDRNILTVDQHHRRIVRWNLETNMESVIGIDQLARPTDFAVNKQNQSVIIPDLGNRRVVGLIDRNERRNTTLIDNIDCYGVAIDKEGYLYVSDCQRHNVYRLKVRETQPTIVAGGNNEGQQLNQLNHPRHLFVDDEQSVYVSDSLNHRVVKWRRDAKEGVVVAGGNGNGNRLNQLSGPQGLHLDEQRLIYIADTWNHRVVCWREGESEGQVVVGANRQSEESARLFCPIGLSFDKDGNLYVTDCGSHRIVKFDLAGN